ncbi:carboxypeptidase-like regulatory domain-containing protein [Lutibacter sp. TH_r2]|uniref:carboxypeptidase-like regulatory domain-containing protein n=1 Tax=Lutibacter sp. TH_r2 TaxID=3082083 RepID=UPI00295531B4|nr:carboxypeptidase-like regulatory domain-containing protein [Lutibacter sp. TH_r2]MDV7188077.1 carboxypeptidase-like regulatory domain-containing protein [Lutibacter sp. TH_r2]
MKTTTNLFLFLFFSINTFSQESKLVEIEGIITSSNKAISNIHIVNLTKGFGAISDDDGNFKLMVETNDEILFSSIQYETKRIIINKTYFKSKLITVKLTPAVTILDEVFLHGLSGNLTADISQVPIDTIPKANFTFDKQDIYRFKKSYTTHYDKTPNSLAFTDPTFMGGGIGGSASIPDFRLIKEQRLKRMLKKKMSFSQRLISEFGMDFFLKDLKINKDSIELFINFCENKNLFSVYESNQKLKAIEILTEQRKKFYELNH